MRSPRGSGVHVDGIVIATDTRKTFLTGEVECSMGDVLHIATSKFGLKAQPTQLEQVMMSRALVSRL
jgi:hypothetical protein